MKRLNSDTISDFMITRRSKDRADHDMKVSLCNRIVEAIQNCLSEGKRINHQIGDALIPLIQENRYIALAFLNFLYESTETVKVFQRMAAR